MNITIVNEYIKELITGGSRGGLTLYIYSIGILYIHKMSHLYIYIYVCVGFLSIKEKLCICVYICYPTSTNYRLKHLSLQFAVFGTCLQFCGKPRFRSLTLNLRLVYSRFDPLLIIELESVPTSPCLLFLSQKVCSDTHSCESALGYASCREI